VKALLVWALFITLPDVGEAGARSVSLYKTRQACEAARAADVAAWQAVNLRVWSSCEPRLVNG
jgi:hypothetical protein